MNEETKKKLFPYFAYKYSKQINPEKYGNISDFETWSNLLDENPQDMEAIVEAAAKLPDDEWELLEKQFSSESVQIAKKGAKLDSLKKLKNIKKASKGKKCSCGCDLIQTKEKGGKMISKCACGCEASNPMNVGKMRSKEMQASEDTPMMKQKWERRIKSRNLKKFKK